MRHVISGPLVVGLGLLGLLASTAVVGAAYGAGDARAGRETARMCVACHGIDGVARQPNAATIAGESEIYLVKQLEAFRSGERQDPQMSIIAEGLSDEDIANLAAWFSSIKITVEVPE